MNLLNISEVKAAVISKYDGRNEKLTIDSGVGRWIISKQHCRLLCIGVPDFLYSVSNKALFFFDSVELFRVKIMLSNVINRKSCV